MADDYNLYPLRVFQAVARVGSVTQAAEEIRISQPAVSAHLRSLETRFGGSLFERTPRGMILTTMGTTLLDHANRLFAQIEDMRSDMETAQGEYRGEVTLAASSTPSAYLLPDLLRRFRDRYPAVMPTMTVGDSKQVFDWLNEFRVQLGIAGGLSTSETLEKHPVTTDELRLVGAAGDPLCAKAHLTREDIAGRTLFLRELGSNTRAETEEILGDLLPAFGRTTVMNNTEVIKQCVVAGLGLAVLSSFATRQEERLEILQPVQDTRFRHTRTFYLFRRADRSLIGAADALWRFLIESQS